MGAGAATAREAAAAERPAAAQPEDDGAGGPLTGSFVGLLGGLAVLETAFGKAAGEGQVVDSAGAGVLQSLVANHASVGEDVFLLALVVVSLYALVEMAGMQMKCPHLEARLHTGCNALATLFSLYGIAIERTYRESPDLWWAVATPLLYLVSNLTMTRLMKMYHGPQAYKRLFELGQSFTLSFQGIHLIAWSSVYPELYWLALPFWYWSIKKLLEPVTYMLGVVSGDDAGQVEGHRARSRAWGAFGLELDAFTVVFMGVNFCAAIIDNTYMGVFTLRGPEGFFEVSRSLGEGAADTAASGWGSDHLRTALVKPAVGSLAVSMGVFVGTLCSRGRLPLAFGVPVAALLSALGPWVVFFWHRLIDGSEPWFPEFLGSQWGPGPLGGLLTF